MTEERENRNYRKLLFGALIILSALTVIATIIVMMARSPLFRVNSKDPGKKGIQLSADFVDDAQDLGIDWGFVNFSTELMTKEKTGLSVERGGRTFYFDEKRVAVYDEMISRLSGDGVRIVAAFLNQRNDSYPELIYPGATDRAETMYYAFNTESEEGCLATEAFAEFLTARYTEGSHGYVSEWLVGNEVNDNLQYHYMLPCDMQSYVKAYYDEFKLFYGIIKEHDKDAEVYIPLEHRWQTANTDTDYGGRWFLEYFHELEKQDTQMDWGLAWHPYPYPLGDPDTLDDGDYPTIDTDETPSYGGEVTLDYTTPIISMKNLDILTDYFKENLLKEDGSVRSIILSEVGYTSFSVIVGDNEAKQAANIAYAYYKAEANPLIKALIIRAHMDVYEGSPYFKFGLRRSDEERSKKLSYDVFKTLGTYEGTKYDGMLLSVLGADSWSELIPDYKKPSKGAGVGNIFSKTESAKNTLHESGNDSTRESAEGKPAARKDISSCRAESIQDQVYTGLPIIPAVNVYDGDKLLEEKEDYNISVTSNVLPGKARVSIVGIKGYEGFFETSFTITGKYADILDPEWYLKNDPEAMQACGGDVNKAEEYFLKEGITKGKRGCKEFDVRYYLNNYPEIKEKCSGDYMAAAEHYIREGKAKGLVADRMLDSAVLEGADYTYVYDAAFAAERNPEIFEACGGDPLTFLEYFVNTGMDEGMRGAEWFDPELYRELNPDLSEMYGEDMKAYYLHYMESGFAEGRPACGFDPMEDTNTVYKGMDYSPVFDADYYISHYDDAAKYVKEKGSKNAALEHFVLWGMKQGRCGNDSFDPVMYRALYSDVREAYGDLWGRYYIHYIRNGRNEGRFTSVKAIVR